MLRPPFPLHRNTLVLLALHLALGCGFTLLAYCAVHRDERLQAQIALEQSAGQAADTVDTAVRQASAAVSAVAAYASSAGSVTWPGFSIFAAALYDHVRGIQALEWSETIGHDDVARVERAQRAAGQAGFTLSERSAHGRALPLADRPTYTPVLMAWPVRGNEAAIGFDLASRADRRSALLQARRSGRTAMTSRLVLVQDTSHDYGIIIIKPVRRSIGAFHGYAMGVFRMTGLLHLRKRPDGIRFAIFDSTAAAGPGTALDLLYPYGLNQTAQSLQRLGAASHQLMLYGRTWTVFAWNPSGTVASNWRSLLVLLVGLFVTLTSLAFHLLYAGRHAAVEREVAARTLRLNQALHALTDSQKRFRDFLSTASDWYYETDAQYRFTYGTTQSENAAESNFAGRLVRSFIGLDHITADDPALEVARRRSLLDRHAAFESLRVILPSDGGQTLLVFNGKPVCDEQGAFLGYRGSVRDMTAANKAEAAERSARVAAEAASRSKSAFLANMSHELRTPMNGLVGMAQLLRHSGLTPDQEQRVELMLRSAAHLLTVLNDILDYSKLEVDTIVLERIPCDLVEIVRDALELVRQSAEEKGIGLLCDLPAIPPPPVLSDPVRIRQILLNLMTNAVKFTARGSVRVSLGVEFIAFDEAEQNGPRQLEARMTVSDTGIGMDKVTMSRLFGRFMQADPSSTRRFGGTGLGLSIAQRLARMLDGDITVQSEAGHGSVFTARMTLEIAATQSAAMPERGPARQPHAGEQHRLRILAAEDDEINQLVLRGFLEPYGHQLILAGDGEEVIALHQRHDCDIILMDVMMPGTDGIEATRRIRAMPAEKGRVPIIALTANAMLGDREAYLAAGMDDYVSKPIARAALYRAIEARLGRHAFARHAFARHQARKGEVQQAAGAAFTPSAQNTAMDEKAAARITDFVAALDAEMTGRAGRPAD